MNEEKKIEELTVEEYMSVIEKPQSEMNEDDRVIWNKFTEAARSQKNYMTNTAWNSTDWTIKWKSDTNSTEYDISYAWGSFNAILVVFQYLYYDNLNDKERTEKALNLEALFNCLKNDQNAGINITSNAQCGFWYVFRIQGNDFNQATATFNMEVQNTKDNNAYNENFKHILGNCKKESTISKVLRQLEPYVRDEPKVMAGFKEMARRGFDVDLNKGPLWEKCEQLYGAGARQIVFTGAPGTGKTFTAKQFAKAKVLEFLAPGQDWKAHIKTVQFHSGYDYSDFVEGLRPVQIEGEEKMTFVRLDGHFKEFCRKIPEKGDNTPYFFIIDEINRADLSRVFGELMFCLDESKRPNAEEGRAAQKITTQYSNLPTYYIKNGEAKRLGAMENEVDKYAEGFYIPENLCILATMNDIDRSVETFDFALRRRFKWIRADANAELRSGLMGMLKKKGISDDKIVALAGKIEDLNNVITGKEGEKLRLNEDYHIGHAYFEKYTVDEDKNENNLQVIWDTQIEQILREYCRGRSNTKQVDEFVEACHNALFPQPDNATTSG